MRASGLPVQAELLDRGPVSAPADGKSWRGTRSRATNQIVIEEGVLHRKGLARIGGGFTCRVLEACALSSQEFGMR